MARADRNGNRKSRDSFKKRVPDLGYYFVVTDTNETEGNYMYGLRDSLPKEYQELLCRGWFLPPNTYDCGSFVVNGTAVVGKEPKKAL